MQTTKKYLKEFYFDHLRFKRMNKGSFSEYHNVIPTVGYSWTTQESDHHYPVTWKVTFITLHHVYFRAQLMNH